METLALLYTRFEQDYSNLAKVDQDKDVAKEFLGMLDEMEKVLETQRCVHESPQSVFASLENHRRLASDFDEDEGL